MAKIIPAESGPPLSLAPFGKLAYSRLQDLSIGGLAGREYIRVSGVLQLCAYLYETGAVLGRVYRGRVNNILAGAKKGGKEQWGLWDLNISLINRLQYTSRFCESLYTFYLNYTMDYFNIDFSVWGMKQAHNDLRTLREVLPQFDYAGAEGVMIGSAYPDLTGKLYNKTFDSRSEIVREMKAYGIVAPEESEQPDISEREQVVIGLYKKYFF